MTLAILQFKKTICDGQLQCINNKEIIFPYINFNAQLQIIDIMPYLI
jgi:hypothetical protein